MMVNVLVAVPEYWAESDKSSHVDPLNNCHWSAFPVEVAEMVVVQPGQVMTSVGWDVMVGTAPVS